MAAAGTEDEEVCLGASTSAAVSVGEDGSRSLRDSAGEGGLEFSAAAVADEMSCEGKICSAMPPEATSFSKENEEWHEVKGVGAHSDES